MALFNLQYIQGISYNYIMQEYIIILDNFLFYYKTDHSAKVTLEKTIIKYKGSGYGLGEYKYLRFLFK